MTTGRKKPTVKMKNVRVVQSGKVAIKGDMKFHGTRVRCSANELHRNLYEYALEMIGCFGDFRLSEDGRSVAWAKETKTAGSGLSSAMWLCFCVGVECLTKAVLIKYEVSIISNSRTTRDVNKLRQAGNIEAAKSVFGWIQAMELYANSWNWMKRQLRRNDITRFYDLSARTFDKARKSLPELVKRGVMAVDECKSLQNAILVLASLRRNPIAHTAPRLRVHGSINGDIESLYVPAVNKLIEVYHRNSADGLVAETRARHT